MSYSCRISAGARNALIALLAALVASPALATPVKCVDAKGNVTYTDTACPDGHQTTGVEDTVSVVDNSGIRSLIAEEQAKAAQLGDQMLQGTMTAANQAKLGEARELIQTAMSARQQLIVAAAIIFASLALFLIFSRRIRGRRPQEVQEAHDHAPIEYVRPYAVRQPGPQPAPRNERQSHDETCRCTHCAPLQAKGQTTT